MGNDLLQTKLFIPPSQPNLVPRTHLHARLNLKLQHGSKLTLFSAPAGFGKTTLAANWLRESGLQIAWLSLDEADDDPARFTAYLLATLQQHGLATGDAVQEISSAPQSPPLEVLLTAIINDILSQRTPLALVLDDYHLLENPVIHQALSFLIEHQPAPLHLVVITREDPPLPLARFHARQQMTEIRLADLRFNSEEISILLNDLMGLNLNPGHIKTLADRTEGLDCRPAIGGPFHAGPKRRGRICPVFCREQPVHPRFSPGRSVSTTIRASTDFPITPRSWRNSRRLSVPCSSTKNPLWAPLRNPGKHKPF